MKLKILLFSTFMLVTINTIGDELLSTYLPAPRGSESTNLRDQDWKYFDKIPVYDSYGNRNYRDYQLYYKEVGRNLVLRVSDGYSVYTVSRNHDYGNLNSNKGFFEYRFSDAFRWLYLNIQ